MPRSALRPRIAIAILALFACFHAAALLASPSAMAAPAYSWLETRPASASQATLTAEIPPPPGFERKAVPPGSFAAWLRDLPMKPKGSPVLLHTGALKSRQDVHASVIDIDVGKRDLQQCADAIMRLRAEWLYASGRAREIAFNDTDGKRRRFAAFKQQDYRGFRKYMDLVFAYAGTYSLERELKPVGTKDLAIGDIFIKGGFPGHAVLVVDMAVNSTTGEKRFLLMQSYMPAQEMHILKNPSAEDGSPWYPEDFGPALITPEWTFPARALKRWP